MDQDFISTCLYLNDIKLPTTYTNVFFDQCFKSSSKTDESRNFIASLSCAQKDFINKLNQQNTDLLSVISSIDCYLPLLFFLLNSLQNQNQVNVDFLLCFRWHGAITASPNITSSEVIIFDLINVIHTKAIAHYKVALNSLKNDNRNLNFAGQHLMTAAGVMRFLASDLIPKWLSRPSVVPPEANETMCYALECFFKACAQKCALVKAVLKEVESQVATPPQVLCKLSCAVVEQCSLCLNTALLLDTKYMALVDRELLLCAAFHRDWFSSLACLYQGDYCRAKEQIGQSLGYYAKAKRLLLAQAPPPQQHSFAALNARGTAALSAAIDVRSAACAQDNRMVYFQAVPPEQELPELPEGAFIMATQAFQPPLPPGGIAGLIMFADNVPKLSAGLETR